MTAVKLSVVIVAYNSRLHLERCLPRLEDLEMDHEIIIVDNGSTDGTLSWLGKHHLPVRVIRSMENGGYALGNNLGVQAARGEYILLLNPDTEAYPGAIDVMLQVAQDNPDAAVTPKVMTAEGKINACGSGMHYTGITTCNGIGESPDSYHGVFDVLLLSGAACLIPRSMWDQLGGFDAEFFMYMEDVELSLRMRMQGFRILCAADAIIVHHYDFAMNERKFYYLERNRLIMLIKCYQLRTVKKLFFAFLLTELATWSFAILKGRKYVWARMQGYRWILRNVKYLARGRRREQQARQVSDSVLLSQMDHELKFGQLVWKPVASFLHWGTTPLYKFIQRRGIRATMKPPSHYADASLPDIDQSIRATMEPHSAKGGAKA